MVPTLIIELVSAGVISFIVFALFLAILLNFMNAQGEKQVKKEKKSIVETGSMVGFFLVFYFVIRLRIGDFQTENLGLRVFCAALGLLIMVIGCIVNIKGRMALGNNWANQIRIYKHHHFVKSGMYRIVRHPLYASLIWIFYGASVVYLNWLAFILNTLIFIPFMTHRAKLEENELAKQFKEYKTYQKEVGMFFPKMNNG